MVKYCCKCEQHDIILNNHCAIDHLITLIVPSLFPRESSGGSDLERSPSGRGRPTARRPERRLGDRQWWLESSRWLSMVLVFLPTKLADWLIFHILFGQMLVNIPAPWEHMGIVITCLPKQISAYRGQFMSGPNQDVFSGFSGGVCVGNSFRNLPRWCHWMPLDQWHQGILRIVPKLRRWLVQSCTNHVITITKE